MQYWINHNGVQSGPLDLDALKEMGLTSSAYVWHEGLADWVKITQLPELQGLYAMETPVMGTPLEAVRPVEPAQRVESPQHVEAVADDTPKESVTPMADAVEGTRVTDNRWESQPNQGYAEPAGQQYAAPAPGPTKPAEPCPPTNLAWAIISTVLCCLPAGIVAIVYAVKVTNKYNAGDIDGAKRASETGAWWCIASIILGIISQPFLSLLPSLIATH